MTWKGSTGFARNERFRDSDIFRHVFERAALPARAFTFTWGEL
jgi:hypothetical protein